MNRKRFVVRVLLAAACFGASLGYADETNQKAPFNAALAYWPASVQFRDRELSKKEREILARAESVPLDKHVAELVERSETFLSEVRRGARSPHCDWGTEFSSGPWTLLPHFDYFAGPAVGLLILRARLSLRNGDDEEAVDDLGAALMVARHGSSEGLLIGINYRWSTERKVIQIPADNLENIHHRASLKLQSHIDRLPPAPTAADGILREKQIMLGWLRSWIEKDGPAGAARELRLTFVGDEEEKQRQKAQLAEQVAGAGEKALLGWMREAEQFYDETAEHLRRPLPAFEDAHAEVMKKLAAANPLVRLLLDESFMRSIADIRRRELEADVRLAMLKAATSVAYYGKPTELDKFTDPAGDGPFRFQKVGPLRFETVAERFRLESKLQVDGKPFAMTFHATVR